MSTIGGIAELLKILMTDSKISTRLAPLFREKLEMLGCEVEGHLGAAELTISTFKIVDSAVSLGVPWIRNYKSNNRLLKQVELFKPNIVWIFKGMDILPSTIRQVRRQGIKVVNFNPDHPFEFAGPGSGNKNVENSVGEFDLYITFSRAIAAQISERYPKLATAVLPFGHNVDNYTYQGLERIKEKVRLCFFGNPDDHRILKLRSLVDAGMEVDVYGYGWPKFIGWTEGIYDCGPAEGRMNEILREYRVQLNFFRPHNESSHNLRSFEIPATGSIMLAPRSIEHNLFFKEDREAYYFDNDEEMISKARKLLSMNHIEAAHIRNAARSRCVHSGYSIEDRAQDVVKLFEEIAK